MYFYIESETNLWTVGREDSKGNWIPESDHKDKEDAAERVHYLNGEITDYSLIAGLKRQYGVTIFEKVKDGSGLQVSEKLIQIQAVVNVLLAENNFNNYDVIVNALQGESVDTIQHVKNKYLFEARKSIVRLLPMLSESYQGKIILYILEHYKGGVNLDTVARYYVPK